MNHNKLKEDNEIVKLVAEQKIRSMRLAGAMLKETELANSSIGNQYTEKLDRSEEVTSPTLSSLGLTKNESSTYQKLASLNTFKELYSKLTEL